VIRSIEGLRGVAALMVVFFHAFVLARWGGVPAQWGLVQNAWLFVDLFFVISGAIMAMVYGQRLRGGRAAASTNCAKVFRLPSSKGAVILASSCPSSHMNLGLQ